MATASVYRTIPFTEEQRRQIEQHVDLVLAGKAFAASRRAQSFLRYVVAETLAGRGGAIKERNIAVDVFSKSIDFDSQQESIVRVNAADVRKRLANAYGDDSSHPVRMELPLGSYQPVFEFAKPTPEEPELTTPLPNRSNRTWPYWAVGAVLLSLVCATALAMRAKPAEAPPLELLWQSFSNQPGAVLISLPAPTVLELSHKDKWLPLSAHGNIPAPELRAKYNYYVGLGAAYGAARFAEQLALRHQSFYLKFGSDVAFADLNHSPTILLGGYTSQWTMDLTRKLRFRLDMSENDRTILDSAGAGRRWTIAVPNGSAEPAEGYSLLTRLLNSESGSPLLIAAGLTARDTQGAVEFLTNPAYFNAFAKTMPADWPRRNFQVVVHNYIHGYSPGAPSVVAWHVW